MSTLRTFHGDTGALSPLILLGVVIVLTIVAVAIVVMAMGPPEESVNDRPDEDDIAEINITPKIGDFDNQIGKVKVSNVKWKPTVTPFNYDKYEGGWHFPGLRLASLFENEFLVVASARLTGPNGLESVKWDTQHITVDEWHEIWEMGKSYSVDFKEFEWFVSEPGSYTITLEIIVSEDDQAGGIFDALADGILPGEGVDNDLAYSGTSKVWVNKDGTGY